MSLNSSARDVAGFVVMAGSMALLASYVVPGARALPRARRVIAGVAAFVAVWVVHGSGLLRVVHEDVSNRIGGEFDELSTWLMAFAGGLFLTVCGRVVLRQRRVRPKG